MRVIFAVVLTAVSLAATAAVTSYAAPAVEMVGVMTAAIG